MIDWTVVENQESAQRFGDQLVEAPRSFAERTSISAAIDFAVVRFDRAPYASDRRVIDISGDGTNNAGRYVANARDDAVARGITINGLVILTATPELGSADHTNQEGGLENYYRDHVIGGPGAFVTVAEN